MDSAWCFGINMTGESVRCTKASNKVVEALFVLGVLWVELLKTAFEPKRSKDCRSPVTWANNIDTVKVILASEKVQVGIDEGQSWACSPVS